VVVRVDQSWQNDVIAPIQDGIGRWRQLLHRSHLLNHVITGEQASIRNFSSLVVHGNQDGRVLNQ
jgi:hypothetical protein